MRFTKIGAAALAASLMTAVVPAAAGAATAAPHHPDVVLAHCSGSIQLAIDPIQKEAAFVEFRARHRLTCTTIDSPEPVRVTTLARGSGTASCADADLLATWVITWPGEKTSVVNMPIEMSADVGRSATAVGEVVSGRYRGASVRTVVTHPLCGAREAAGPVSFAIVEPAR
ncbi:hypothetical protein [Streptomyces sp. NPDC054865]